MCDCNCIDTTINCECPSPNPLEGAELDSVLSTTFDGAPLNIYNGGSGASTTIYTNSSTANQYIILHSNMYITSNSTHNLSSFYYANIISNVFNLGSIHTYNAAPVKTTLNALLTSVILLPGDSIKLHVTSSDSTARMNWLTTFIYKYQY